MVTTMAQDKDWDDEEELDEGTLVLVNEEGENVSFDLLDSFEFGGAQYVAVVPSEAFYEDEEDDEDAEEDDEDEEVVEVAILRVEVAEDGENEYQAIDDDALLTQLFEEFHDRHVGEFYFE